ncbi:hypothetical protein [Chryseobacterium sp.]|uniref:hypothetical protein n=1 Tax=Chryseobacterium sp. TaxID=1871047 RepID=UPI002FCBC3E1
MEIINDNPEILLNENLYTISWSDIENEEPDYENYLTEIENFFRENSENNLLEEDMF